MLRERVQLGIITAVAVVLLVLIVRLATAADEWPTGLVCTFEITANPINEQGSLSFDVSRSSYVFMLGAIDLTAGTAQMISDAGTERVRAWSTPHGLNFLEVTPTGNANLMTVILNDGEASHFAVYSRHVAMFDFTNDPPVSRQRVSQNAGRCEIPANLWHARGFQRHREHFMLPLVS